MLLVIYIKTKPIINLKRGMNIQICTFMILNAVCLIVRKTLFNMETIPCSVLSAFCSNSQLLVASLVCYILLLSYLFIYRTHWIKIHYNCFQYIYVIVCYVFFIVFTVWNWFIPMEDNKYGDCKYAN